MRTKTRVLLPAGALAALILAAACAPPPKPPIKVPPKPPVTAPPTTVTACPAVPANAVAGPDSLNPIAGASGVQGTAKTAVVIGNVVYVGGTFGRILLPNGAVATGKSNLAAFCLANGKLLNSFTANLGGGPVNALATDGASLYVGGNFTTLNGQPSNRLVKLDPRTGTRIASFNPPQIPYFKAPAGSDGVLALAYFGGNIYAGGDFGKIGSPTPNKPPAVTVGNAAAFNATSGAYTNWHAGTDKKVESIAVNTNSVFIGGSFSEVNEPAGVTGTGVAHDKLAKLSRTTGTVSPVSYGTVGARPLGIGLNADESIIVALGPASPGGSGLGDHITYYDAAGAVKWTDANPKGDVQAVQIVGARAYVGLLTGYANPSTNTALRLLGIDFSKSPGTPTYMPYAPPVVGGTGVYGLAAAGNRLVAVGDFSALGSTTGLHGLAIFN